MIIRSTEDRENRIVVEDSDWGDFVQVMAITNPGALMMFSLLIRQEDEGETFYLQPESLTGLAATLWTAKIRYRQKGVIPTLEKKNDIPDAFLRAFGEEARQDVTPDEDGLIPVEPFDEETVVAYASMVAVEYWHKGELYDVDRHTLILHMNQDAPEGIPITVARGIDLPEKPEDLEDLLSPFNDPTAAFYDHDTNPYVVPAFDTDNTGGPLLGWTGTYTFPCRDDCSFDWNVRLIVFAKKTSDEELRRNGAYD